MGWGWIIVDPIRREDREEKCLRRSAVLSDFVSLADYGTRASETIMMAPRGNRQMRTMGGSENPGNSNKDFFASAHTQECICTAA